jgi:hypothetical protein
MFSEECHRRDLHEVWIGEPVKEERKEMWAKWSTVPLSSSSVKVL